MTSAHYILALLCLAHGAVGARIHKSGGQANAGLHMFSRANAEEPEEVKKCRKLITKDEIALCMCSSVNDKGLGEEDLYDACAELKAETMKLASRWQCAVRVTENKKRCIRLDKEEGHAEKDEEDPAKPEEQAPVPTSEFRSRAGDCKKTHGRANRDKAAECVCKLANGKGLSQDDVKSRCKALRFHVMRAAMPWACNPLQTSDVTRCVPFYPFRRTPESKSVDVIPDGGDTPVVEKKQADEAIKDDPMDDILDEEDFEDDEEIIEEPDPIDCKGSWQEGECDKPCGGGSKSITFHVETQAAHGGKECPESKNEDCNTDPCAVDCEGSYAEWGACSADCGGGTQTREYKVTVSAEHGGKACPEAQSQNCNTNPCPVDCEGSWGDYGACSKECGGGEQTRSFTVSTPAAHGGEACPSTLQETQACNSNPCPVDCKGSWGAWGKCSEECGGGTQSQAFAVSTAAAFGGKACPTSPVSQDCNTHECPVHCEGNWGKWGECTAKCGGGSQTRVWITSTASANGGKKCPASPASQPCNEQPCPVDCVYTWGGWNSCSKKCGGGTQQRSIVVHAQDAHGGKACPASPINQACNTHVCPRDCKGSYGGWSACSKGCGGGSQTKTYHVTQQPVGGGKECPANQNQACNTHPCPVNCDYGWGGWSGCSRACGSGSQTRNIAIRRHAAHGGRACPSSPESRSCNNQACYCGHFQTSFNDDGNGNSVYFDRHAVNCGNRKLSRWKLMRDHWHNNIKFLFSCCDTPRAGGCGWRYTGFNDDGDGESVYLDRHDVRCNHGEGLSYWHLQRGSGGSGWGARRRTIRMQYKCCAVPGIASCSSYSTWLNSDGGGETVYFDRHDLDCHRFGKTVMTRWRLNRAGTSNRIRFDYTCCNHR